MTDSPRTGRRMVIYARISDDREGRQNGVDRQERQCRALADKNGDEIIAVFTDDDRSAYSGKPRPDYLKMLAFLRAGHAEGAYALAPTRFYRRLDDGLEFFKLIAEKALEVETVKAGRYNLATADGRRDALRAAVDAQHEAEQISERVRDAKADNLAKGEYRGGPRPFGYEGDGVTVREDEARHVRAATDAVIAGDSLRSICRTLAEQGARTVPRRYKQPDGSRGEPESREWTASELRKMLLRPRNAGLMEHRGEIVGKAAWDPLVPEETWRACKAVLERAERRTTTGNARTWLGSGLYRCGVDECPETVRCSTSGKGSRNHHVPAYRCRTGKHVTRVAGPLDEHVTNLVLVRLSRPDAASALLPPPRAAESREDLAATANALRAKLDTFVADYAADLITRQQMLDGTALTRQRLEQIEAKMAAQAQQSVLAGLPLGTPKVVEEWTSYHLDKQRAIVDALMTVYILPARRGRPAGFQPGVTKTYFNPDAVRIEWKQQG
ncbi:MULTISPECIES: recombinase family protein [unclassified Streptomyces]|uniref:recombinase family protein n=1 Tax=unclassified Streptomyces TaxID=2593676 RepID=UPI0009A0B640|nr:recombinase family protein [Streptomyces sp. CB01883]